jgi:hypothetical protein
MFQTCIETSSFEITIINTELNLNCTYLVGLVELEGNFILNCIDEEMNNYLHEMMLELFKQYQLVKLQKKQEIDINQLKNEYEVNFCFLFFYIIIYC